MANLTQASRQWASRPDDERFTSLLALRDHCQASRDISRPKVVSSRALTAAPVEGDNDAMAIIGPNGGPTVPTHWAFGQLCAQVSAPAAYLRTLPAPLAADAMNWGFKNKPLADVGVLLRKNGGPAELAAVTGPNYGRVWNADVAQALVDRFGDGVTGEFTVPGEFGVALEKVTKRNTTIYGSDRDMWVFLADEKNRIEIPNRRDGQPGSLARGFFVWNSEVGACTLGIATFLFDYACQNRIVWGAEGYREIRIRHTVSAPDRWIEEVVPAVRNYASASASGITNAIAAARSIKIGDQDGVAEFLASRFTKGQARAISLAHEAEEGRPIETLWDAATGATAYARSIAWQDDRVKIERVAGSFLSMAA
jgi:hypothetical protein